MTPKGGETCEPIGGGERDLTRSVVLGWWSFSTTTERRPTTANVGPYGPTPTRRLA